MKAVILAGGLGTRLSEETSIKPKPMVEIGGKPILWHTVVRPSVHASYDNISHLFPLLLISHVVTYIILIKEGGSERCALQTDLIFSHSI
jgi:2-C-methyl-D-erythritol 4-phosphate cytidylyltransferase